MENQKPCLKARSKANPKANPKWKEWKVQSKSQKVTPTAQQAKQKQSEKVWSNRIVAIISL